MNRRLPIYFLLDTSESMIGEPVAAIQTALHDIFAELRQEPNIADMVYVSIITFDNIARQIIPLTNIVDAEIPNLKIRPGTALGWAFLTLKQCIDKEVIKRTTKEEKADYRPLVFLFTDGCPTDDSDVRHESILRMTSPKIANIYSIACGEDVDFQLLQSFSDRTIKAQDMKPELIQRLFMWISASIQTSVMSLTTAAAQMGLDMEMIPDGFEIIKPGINDERYSGPTPTIFFKVYCSKTNQPYLIRFHYDIMAGHYVPVKTHKIETEDDEEFHVNAPTIKSSLIPSVLPCPYCNNASLLYCGCGAKVCLPYSFGKQWHCIRCNRSGTFSEGGGGDFDVSTSVG